MLSCWFFWPPKLCTLFHIDGQDSIFLLYSILGIVRFIVSGSIQPPFTHERNTSGQNWDQTQVLLLSGRFPM